MRRELLSAVLACALPAWAGEAPLILDGQTAAYYGVTIPLAVVAQARFRDLSDVRVLNARGEPVPHAWVDEMPTNAQHRVQEVPLFHAPDAIVTPTPSRQAGWIVDLRVLKGNPLVELRLGVAPGSHQGIYYFYIEASDDLQQWRMHTAAAQLVWLQRQGLGLEHASFDLSGLRAQYLRLRPEPGSAQPPLASAAVTSVTHYQATLPLQWSEPLPPTQCTAQYCDYAVPRHLPLERLEFRLAETNTLAPVELLALREQGSATPAQRHPRRHRLRDHVRDRLHGVRHKDSPAPPAEPSAVWSPLLHTTVYRLNVLHQGDVYSPALQLDAGPVAQLRVQPQGGMVQLGARPPTLRVGAKASALVFLARGPLPYRLAWGGDTAAAMSLSQLMPTRKAGDSVPVDTASVVLPVVAAPVVSVASATPPAASPVATGPEPSRKLWLWGVLLVALAVMGVMAWQLLRPAKKG